MGSPTKFSSSRRPNPVAEAIARHTDFESASFHTPGHKGRKLLDGTITVSDELWLHDVTELPGLDDLSYPNGILADLQRRAAHLWGASESLISLNGASVGLSAAMLALAEHGSTVLVPRNAHRSIIHGLVLSGLFPIWYEPIWDDDWGIWGPVTATSAERLLARSGNEVAGLVLVSPTYAGALSEIQAIVQLSKSYGIALVVDEAHGGHFLPNSCMPQSAVSYGADVVVQSLHKTLPALTQTGIVHVSEESQINRERLRSALRCLQTSSPSYLLLSSAEQAISCLEGKDGLKRLEKLKFLSDQLLALSSMCPNTSIYQPPTGTDPAHMLVKIKGIEPETMSDFLCKQGVFPEAALGNGVLFMLGLGSNESDIACLQSALFSLQAVSKIDASEECSSHQNTSWWRPPTAVQVLSPRQAFMMPSHTVPIHQAVGRIAADTIAPCPPGIPILVAGQRVPEEILEFASLQNISVIVE